MDSSVYRGKLLAVIYCQSCHQLPDPALLDKETWVKNVLPGMGPRLGVFIFKGHEYPSKVQDLNIGRKFYPAVPLVNDQQWEDIINYYWASAPDSLAPIRRRETIRRGTDLFRVQVPAIHVNAASTSMVLFDTSSKEKTILMSRVIMPGIYRYNLQWKLLDSIFTKGPVVDILPEKKTAIVCNIGYLNPTDAKRGSIEKINFGQKTKNNTILLFDKLARPVQVIAADLNSDKKTDYLVCEFGNNLGSFSWMENMGGDKFSKHILRGFPGSIKAYVNDYNHDGLPDIWALFAQGDECIILFTNKGHGQFEAKKMLSFPAIYGSTYFELDDFNQDGFPDILYSCGDNADYSPVLKPYHGIYIYLNDGKNNFKQQYFFPMHGCFKAIARDFDGDGDLDIAAISFFPDNVHHPEESFFYLENRGGFQFRPYTIPGTEAGRWLTMDAGDFYGSGKPDIILGNFNLGNADSGNDLQKRKSPPFILLRNIMGNHK